MRPVGELLVTDACEAAELGLACLYAPHLSVLLEFRFKRLCSTSICEAEQLSKETTMGAKETYYVRTFESLPASPNTAAANVHGRLARVARAPPAISPLCSRSRRSKSVVIPQ
jgi:hypothetical protein